MQKFKDTYVYIATCGDFAKVGASEEPEKRIHTLQTGNPHRIILYEKIKFCTWEEAYAFESEVQEYFRKYNIRGEWFYISSEFLGWMEKIREYVRSNQHDLV